MLLNGLQNKDICVLGYGIEGKAVIDVLQKYVPNCRITIADSKQTIDAATNCQVQLGKDWLQNLERFDYIIASPGIPPLPELDALQPKITTSTQIFLEEVESRGGTVIGITGSKGKSTVSSLIYAILAANNQDVHLVGNIGIPSIESINQAKPGTFFVLEMSSYQLRYCTNSPHIAVVTSFFPDHLDYHSQEPHVRIITNESAKHEAAILAYKQAKMHITAFQTAADYVFADTFTPGAVEIAQASVGTICYTSSEDSPIQIEESNLLGLHNLRNLALAFTVSKHCGVPTQIAIGAMKTFKGLPHRLQSIGVYQQIEWVDDAISTTPEAAIAAIDALQDRVTTIIVGGLDRQNDFTLLGKRIVDSNISNVVLFPESGTRIKQAIIAANIHLRPITFKDANSMHEAVKYCLEHTVIPTAFTPIVLLSTASPSYNMFTNFIDKGEQFTAHVKASCNLESIGND